MNEIKMVFVTGCAFMLMTLIAVSCASVGYVAVTGIAAISDVTTTWTHESNATRRTGIEWNSRVRIAETEADAQKKTSWPFVGFYTIRALLWGVGGSLLGLWLWLYKRGGND